MTEEGRPREFTHIAVLQETQQRMKVISAILKRRMYDLAKEWVDSAWEDLVLAGLVSDSSDSGDSSDPGGKSIGMGG